MDKVFNSYWTYTFCLTQYEFEPLVILILIKIAQQTITIKINEE